MILDYINFHKVFNILGNLEGDLISKSFELILFILVTYMLFSEYTRDPRRDLKYILVGFGALAFSKLTSVIVLAGVIFGDIGPSTYTNYFPVIYNIIEMTAIILLVNAFLFPILVKQYSSLKHIIFFETGISVIIYLFFQTIMLYETVVIGNLAPFTNYWSGLLFALLKILILLYAIYTLSVRTDIFYKYRYSIIISFLFYFVSHFLSMMNFLFYEGNSQRLILASHPFPLLAVLLFTRVIYLRLVDKAFLKKKLKISEQKYEHEKELNKMKDKFVSVVSHELRTPLTSLNLYSSLLKEGKFGELTEKQKESVSIINAESKRLTNLVNDILDLSRLESKKIELKISEFDLSEFCKNSPFCILAEKKDIKLIHDIPANFKMRADPEKIKQVIINLVSNALKFTEKGVVRVCAKQDSEKYQIDIIDTGRGIPKAEQEKIFDKFYQVEHYLDREQGFGLGLSITKEIVKAHKGEIKVSSEPEKGSTFSIIIPKNLE